MKKILFNILVLIFISVFKHANCQDSSYSIINGYTYNLANKTILLNHIKTLDGNFLLSLKLIDEKYNVNYCFLKIDPQGVYLSLKQTELTSSPGQFIETEENYCAIDYGFLDSVENHFVSFLMFYDKNWNLVWSRGIDAESPLNSSTVITKTQSNNFLTVSNEYIGDSDLFTLTYRKYNLKGELIFKKSINTKNNCVPKQIINTKDKNQYCITSEIAIEMSGYFYSKYGTNAYLLKTNSLGDTLWTKSFIDFAPDNFIELNDGNLIIYGLEFDIEKYLGYHTSAFLKVIKVDKDGNLIWEKTIRKDNHTEPGNFIVTKSNNLLFSGVIKLERQYQAKSYLFELTQNGDLVLEQELSTIGQSAGLPFLIQSEEEIRIINQRKIKINKYPFSKIELSAILIKREI